MRVQPKSGLAISCLGLAIFAAAAGAHAQQGPRRIALKSGESTALRDFYYVQHCRSIMIGAPVLDVLEGPEELNAQGGHEASPKVHKTSAWWHRGRDSERGQSTERSQAHD